MGNTVSIKLEPESGSDEEGQSTPISMPAVGELAPGEAQAGGMGRHMGFWDTLGFIINRIISVGIFSTPASILQSVNSVGATMLVWLFAWVISIAGLSVWLELGCMYPRSGGEQVYLEAAFPRPRLLATKIYAFYVFFVCFAVTGSIAFAEYVLRAAGTEPTGWKVPGIALSILTFICLCQAVMLKPASPSQITWAL